jgi:predicted MPP superfamily phosphohydrolase
VTGNHENYSGVDAWVQKAQALGWISLVNENRVVSFGRAKVLIGGVPDASRHHGPPLRPSDPRLAITSSEQTQFKVLLSHRSSTAAEAERAGFNLQLSGHTHGGQFFPWSLIIPLAHNYHLGLFRHGEMWVYVTPGTG